MALVTIVDRITLLFMMLIVIALRIVKKQSADMSHFSSQFEILGCSINIVNHYTVDQ